MQSSSSAADDRTWRRGNAARTAPQSIPISQPDQSSRTDRDQDNWRSPPNGPPAPKLSYNTPGSYKDDKASSFTNGHSAFSHHQRNRSQHQHNINSTSLLSSSYKADRDTHAQNLSTSPAVKPSGMGSGVIGRSADMASSPTAGRGLGYITNRTQWPLSSSLEKSPPLAPATLLQPLRIEPTTGSRFFPLHSSSSQPSQNEDTSEPRTSNLSTTHASSLMQPPGQTSAQSSARNQSVSPSVVQQESATVALSRSTKLNSIASPEKSPLVPSTFNPRPLNINASVTPALLHRSPLASPMIAQRTLSPASRQPPLSGDRVVNSISSLLTAANTSVRPTGSTSRRESFGSTTSNVSANAGHTLSHSRRSSAVLSPRSPAPPSRNGVYRPPHLRNRGSFSGLKPSVAHYDRVRTPSLRGLSRSRESSISLSRPSSTLPYQVSPDAPDGHDDDRLRGRTQSFSIHLPDLIAEQQQRTASAASEDATRNRTTSPSERGYETPPQDSASMLATLRAQLVRREAAATEAMISDFDRNGTIFENEEQDLLDMSDMIEYGMSDGYPISRQTSMHRGSEAMLTEVFEIGDLLGPGLEHNGHIINIAQTTSGFDNQDADLTGSKLEVIRKLGEGSYAIVYLVREVSVDDIAEAADSHKAAELHDDDPDLTMVGPSEDLLSSTLKAKLGKDDDFHNSPALERRRRKDLRVKLHLNLGREFALKCLSKRDLSEEMLEVQRLEATIHQSIPAHPNIVTLYRTYETPDWLFLVLEYCPGQDLYYWLEQAQDSGNASDHREHDSSLDNSLSKTPVIPAGKAADDWKFDSTPPSPSILASTSGNTLLSKRRIRLIARMFGQMCEAVQFCHDRGISHRDIKPENFIVEDRRTVEQMLSATFDMSSSTLIGSSRDGDDMQVIVKMTDFGLATAADRCEDFDCGSKPYMAFECHNNISASYDPKQADIWSLGIVLLNMLFHRSPFTEPSMSCPSFSSYCQEPIHFLMDSFDGLSETVAEFLRQNVFCSVVDQWGSAHNRISASGFAKWASKLVDHMGLSSSARVSRGGSMSTTMAMVHSRNVSMSTLPSMVNSPRSRSRSMTLDTDLDAIPDGSYRGAYTTPLNAGLSPTYVLFTPDLLPSPTFTPLPSEHDPFDTSIIPSNLGWATRILEEAENKDALQRKDSHVHQQSDSNDTATRVPPVETDAARAVQPTSARTAFRDQEDTADDVPEPSVDGVNADEEDGAEAESVDAQDGDGKKPESISASNHSKRRKRGARKGRTQTKQLKRSQSVENLNDFDSNDPVARAKERERTIRELALASQSLARQMSRMTKPSDRTDETPTVPVILSKPTAEAAARFSLQSRTLDPDAKTDGAVDSSATTSPGLVPGRVVGTPDSAAQAMANWDSAALRRERMSGQRKTSIATLEDSGRGQPMSWRDRNPSTASISSFTSSINTVSSQSSATSATSSIFSTTSAPAALTRKDYSRRNGTRSSGFGLDTISERERGQAKREVDAQYLAGIFGGADIKKKKAPSTGNALGSDCLFSPSYEGVDAERGRRFSRMSDTGDKSSSTTLLSIHALSAAQDQRSSSATLSHAAGAVSPSSGGSNSSTTAAGSSFTLSRFRRPGSSSAGKSASLQGSETLQAISSADSSAAAADSPSALDDSTGSAMATKKQRGVGKFLLGVRDSMKNF